MRPHALQGSDGGDLDALRDTAREGRAAAMSRRRALAAGSSASARATAETVVAIDGVAAARLGRALSMHRRRQMSQGKQTLTGGDRPPAAAGAEAPAFSVYHGGAR